MDIRRSITLVEQHLSELAPVKNDERVKKFTDLMAANPEPGKARFFAFNRYMADKGFKVLGNGYFGTVFTRDDLDYVIKVFHRDLGYKSFLKYCIANKNNPHLPKVRGKVMTLDNENFLVRLERLSRLSGHYLFFVSQVKDYYDSYVHRSLNDTLAGCERFLAENFYPDFLQKQEYFIETVDDLYHRFGTLDIHQDNIMQRGDTLVITDPVADEYSGSAGDI